MFYIRMLMVVILGVLLSSTVYAQEEGAEGAVEPSSVYVDLIPAFVVNYGGVGKLRYLKTSITLRVDAGVGQTHIRRHMPYLRHKIVMLLSSASDEDMSSMEGRELLRQNALAAVREVLMAEEGEQHVTDLLFSSFIVQS
jgi:flagellar FliL protein